MMPPLAKDLDLSVPAVGGWMYSSLKRLAAIEDMTVAVATVYTGSEYVIKFIDGVRYYLLPMNGRSLTEYNSALEAYWKSVREDFRPDVVHIHGSELPHGLAYVRTCGPEGVVVSIQGLIHAIARYYTAGIDYRDINSIHTFRDFVKRASILQGQRSFESRGRLEVELLKSVRHIIGRTEWDKAHTWALNPEAEYHYCGETLRDSFYTHRWEYCKCEPHTMFVSQASYPVKGVHMLFKAMPLILREYPDAKVYVAGSDIASMPWWRITGYGKYLKGLINRLGLAGHVEFTDMLDEQAMCARYLISNVFVCCSAIENSPNSLGEAQLLGMPYVASCVGGVPEIVQMNPEVLYRFEEYEMLAGKICDIFAREDSFIPVPFDASRYDAAKNLGDLTDIYKRINAEIL